MPHINCKRKCCMGKRRYAGKKWNATKKRVLGTATSTINIEVKGIEKVKQLVELLREANELAASLEKKFVFQDHSEQMKKASPPHRWK